MQFFLHLILCCSADCLLSNSNRWGWWWWWCFLLIINHNATRCSDRVQLYSCRLLFASYWSSPLVVADKRIALWDVCSWTENRARPGQSSNGTTALFPSRGRSQEKSSSRSELLFAGTNEEMVSYRQRNRNTCTAPSSYYDGHQMVEAVALRLLI